MFAADWAGANLLDTVVRNAAAWVESQRWRVLRRVVRLPGARRCCSSRSPPPRPAPQTVLMYGHLDKQPEFSGWRSDLGPWTPKIDEDGKLYGRGGATTAARCTPASPPCRS